MSTHDPLGNRIPQSPSADPISATLNPMSDPSTLPAPELSFGQKAVGLTFNPG